MLELLSLSREELTQAVKEMGQSAFRGKQLFKWLHAGVPFEQMSNLPAAFRAQLRQTCFDNSVRVIERIESKIDGTMKLLYRLHDGHVIEGVLMRYKHGNTLCLSTQVGCRMGCRFCASTLDGCARNLTSGEMIGQIVCANGVLGEGERVHNVVLMGSGEPLDNYDQVVRFLRLVSCPEGLGIGLRHISLSTCGLVPQVRRFAEEGLPVTLSLSLHAPNDEIRRQLMPSAHRYTMEETLDACKAYLQKTGRRIVLEYALVDGLNADERSARELAGRLRGMQCHVNLIPLNTVPERHLKGVTEKQVQAFLHVLEEMHISATRRREMGDDIEGACGQLRKKHLAEVKKA